MDSQVPSSSRLSAYLTDGVIDAAILRSALSQSVVIALGCADPVEDVSYDNQLLQFTYDNDNRDFVPVFTSMKHLAAALKIRPEWGALGILEVAGDGLLRTSSMSNLIVAVNPWTSQQALLPA